MKTYSIRVRDVEVHDLARLTPTMTDNQFQSLKASIAKNGQEMAVVMYRGKCIDGRHRIKALRELGVENVVATNEDSKMSAEDIRSKVVDVYENRRHQTPTQKAIMAYREWLRLKSLDEKVGQGVVAEQFGTTVKQLGRAKTLHTKAGDDILEFLFQGNKINTGTQMEPSITDSLASLINFFVKSREGLLDNSKNSKVSEDFTEEETAALNESIQELKSQYSERMLSRLNSLIFYSLKRDKNKEQQ